uniref:Uncharacterized protein n=1 Tax=Stomoxys calcitrans TaxID=35570 RepID=A0A1I8NX56_STOCA|nr:unnamed protein product [Stomoxys calcitrans]
MIFNKSTKGFERSLFLGAFILAIFLLAVITFNIYYIYRYEPLSTCISDLAYPVYKIPFPEIAICNRNRLNWQRYNEAKIKFLKREHRTPVYEDLFKEVVNAYDTLRFGRFNNFENLYHNHAPHLLKQLNYVNLTQVDERDSVYFKSLAGRDYMYENCQSQCEQEYLVKFCNCTVDMFFPPGQRYRACRLTDLPCLYHHNGR